MPNGHEQARSQERIDKIGLINGLQADNKLLKDENARLRVENKALKEPQTPSTVPKATGE